MSKKAALVIGAGAFGSSIASVLSENFDIVYLQMRSEEILKSIKDNRENSIYLPGLKLSEKIQPILSFQEIKLDLSLVVNGLPTAAITPFYKANQIAIEQYLEKDIPFISLAKGIDTESLLLPDDMLEEIFPRYKENLCYLSGPSFAKEIVQKQITLVSVAGKSRQKLLDINEMMCTPYFKTFPTYDIKGLLLGGALKNILAICGGIIEGLGFNHNTRAAMITRGILEMRRFGKVYNVRPETLYGLSGMGDLILTTTGGLSRNKQFGVEIAKGRKPQEIIESTRSVVEGYKTTLAAKKLATKFDIHTRIFEGVYQVLYQDADVNELIAKLMSLPSKFEE